jgi:hypothetical protein
VPSTRKPGGIVGNADLPQLRRTIAHAHAVSIIIADVDLDACVFVAVAGGRDAALGSLC